jgi:hypothetical protein
MPGSPSDNERAQNAFWNAWNLAGLALVATAAAVTRDPWFLAAGAALEGLWMSVASQSPRIARALRGRERANTREQTLRTTLDEIGLLPSSERLIVQRVATAAAEIRDECRRNPRLGAGMLSHDLDRLEQTIAEYVHLAVLAWRCDTYLARADARQITRERDEWQQAAGTEPDEGTRLLAAQNVAVLERRLALMDEIRKFVARARGQLALVQNTVALVRDQVLTMSTPQTVVQELDALVVGLDAIREATREVEGMISPPTQTSAAATMADPNSGSHTRPRLRG